MPVYSVKVPNGEIYQINAPEGASEDDILGFAQASYAEKTSGATSAVSEPPQDPYANDSAFDFSGERNIFGAVKEAAKAPSRGFFNTILGSVEGTAELVDAATNFVGLDDLIDSGDENAVVWAANAGKDWINKESGAKADPRYQDLWTTKFGEGVGSFASFLTPTLVLKGASILNRGRVALEGAQALGKLSRAEKIATGAFAATSGAGEAAQRAKAAREEGLDVSEGEEDFATAQGALVGLTEMLPISRILGRVPKNIPRGEKDYLVNLFKSAGIAAAEEGGQEVGAAVLQNMIERGYNPNQEIFEESLMDDLTVGGAVGALADITLNAFSGRRKGYMTDAQKENERKAREIEARNDFQFRQEMTERKRVADMIQSDPEAFQAEADRVQGLASTIPAPTNEEVMSFNQPSVAGAVATPETLGELYSLRIVGKLGSFFPTNTSFTVEQGEDVPTPAVGPDGTETVVPQPTFKVVDSTGKQYGQTLSNPDVASSLARNLNGEIVGQSVRGSILNTLMTSPQGYNPEQSTNLFRYGFQTLNPESNNVTYAALNDAAGTTTENGYIEEVSHNDILKSPKVLVKGGAGKTAYQVTMPNGKKRLAVGLTASQELNRKREEAGLPPVNSFNIRQAREALGGNIGTLSNPSVTGIQDQLQYAPVDIGGKPAVVSQAREVLTKRKTTLAEKAKAGFKQDGTSVLPDYIEFQSMEDAKRYADSLNKRNADKRFIPDALFEGKTDLFPQIKALLETKNIDAEMDSDEVGQLVKSFTGARDAKSMSLEDQKLFYARLRNLPGFSTKTKLPVFRLRPYSPEQFVKATQYQQQNPGAVTDEGLATALGLEPTSPRIAAIKSDLQKQTDARLQKEVLKNSRLPLVERLRKALDDYGLSGVTLRLEESLQQPDGEKPEGYFDRMMDEVALAIDGIDPEFNTTDEGRLNYLKEVLSHEVVHALRALDLWTAKEWDILTQAAERTIHPETGETFAARARRMYWDKSVEEQIEESIAELARAYIANKKLIGGKPRNLLERMIRLFQRLKAFVTNSGYQNFESILNDMRSGAIASRDRGEVRSLRLTKNVPEGYVVADNVPEGAETRTIQDFDEAALEGADIRESRKPYKVVQPINKDTGRRYSVKDISKLRDEKIPLNVFAEQFADRIKQSDTKLEDANRIAEGFIKEFVDNPSSFLPVVEGSKLTADTFLRMPDGTMYDPEKLAHANATDQTIQVYDAVQNGTIKDELNAQAQKINENRQKNLSKLSRYLNKNSAYSLAEQALIMKGASKHAIRSNKDGGYKLISISDNNNVGVSVITGFEAASVASELRKGKSLKQSMLDGISSAIEAKKKKNKELGYDGWKTFNKSNSEEDAAALKDGCAGREWCTAGDFGIARNYLSSGDFHIFYKNGEPIVALRTIDGRLAEPPRGSLENQFMTEEEEKIAEEALRAGRVTGGKDYLDDRKLISDVMEGKHKQWSDLDLFKKRKRKYAIGYGNTKFDLPKPVLKEIEKEIDKREPDNGWESVGIIDGDYKHGYKSPMSVTLKYVKGDVNIFNQFLQDDLEGQKMELFDLEAENRGIDLEELFNSDYRVYGNELEGNPEITIDEVGGNIYASNGIINVKKVVGELHLDGIGVYATIGEAKAVYMQDDAYLKINKLEKADVSGNSILFAKNVEKVFVGSSFVYSDEIGFLRMAENATVYANIIKEIDTYFREKNNKLYANYLYASNKGYVFEVSNIDLNVKNAYGPIDIADSNASIENMYGTLLVGKFANIKVGETHTNNKYVDGNEDFINAFKKGDVQVTVNSESDIMVSKLNGRALLDKGNKPIRVNQDVLGEYYNDEIEVVQEPIVVEMPESFYEGMNKIKEAFPDTGGRRFSRKDTGTSKDLQGQGRVLFEVAPSPENKVRAGVWNNMPKADKVAITRKIGPMAIREVAGIFDIPMSAFKQPILGQGLFEGVVNPNQILGIKTNKVKPEQAIQVASALGYVLEQKAMVVADGRMTGKETSLVRIYTKGDAMAVADRLYDLIKQEVGDFGGYAAFNDHIDIMNFSSIDSRELASRFTDLINEKAPDVNATVRHAKIQSAYIEEKKYASSIYSGTGRANREGLERRLDSARSRIIQRLESEISSATGQPAAATDTGTVPVGGRVRGSEGVLRFSRRPYQKNGRAGKSLEGLPKQINVDGRIVEFDAFSPAQKVAERYMRKAGLPYNPPTKYVRVDPAISTRIAEEFERIEHDPQNPLVLAAYRQMMAETAAQYREIMKTGLKVEFIKGDDPYGNPRNAILDIVENNHFWVFPTKDGFGSNDEMDVTDNPLLEETEFKDANGETMLANDLFRVVHDYFGHVMPGVGFRADGEENAWRSHAFMYSPLARRAMTSETRGQNSYVNFGPNGEFNRTASPADTIYADQKVGLMPEWVSTDTYEAGAVMPEPEQAAPAPISQEALDEAVAKVAKDTERTPKTSVPLYGENASSEALYVALNPEMGAKLGLDDKKRYSRRENEPQYPPNIQRLIDQTPQAPNETMGQTFIKILQMPSSKDFWDNIRQGLVFRGARLERQYRENPELAKMMADTSSLALYQMTDHARAITQAVITGGIPVYQNGGFKVVSFVYKGKNIERGLLEIMAPLHSKEHGNLERLAHRYAMAIRGERLNNEGKLTPIAPGELQALEAEIQKYRNPATGQPVVREWYEMWQAYNSNIVKYLKDTGVIDDAGAQLWMKQSDYIPFYREDKNGNLIHPKVFGGLHTAGQFKAVGKSSEDLNVDMVTAIVNNIDTAIAMGMKNVAQQRIIRDQINLGLASVLKQGETVGNRNSVSFKIAGKRYTAIIEDPLIYESMLPANEIPMDGLFGTMFRFPANLLRELIIRDPGYMVANMFRDTLSSYVITGAEVVPLWGTAKGFAGDIEKLRKLGVIGGYDLRMDKNGVRDFYDKEAKKMGMVAGVNWLNPVMAAWDVLGRISERSEAATRLAVYEDILKRTGNEVEAQYQALSVMNYGRRGNNPLLRMITALVPFLNARIQGLDKLYQATTGRVGAKYKTDTSGKVIPEVQRRKNFARFLFRAGLITGITAMYYAMVSDDDEYENASPEIRDNYYIIPVMKGDTESGEPGLSVRLPIPFEIGIMFKVIPERLIAGIYGDDTSKDFKDSMKRALFSTLAMNPTPQAILPIAEAMVNKDLYTFRPVVPTYMENLLPEQQKTFYTNVLAEDIANKMGFSPMKVDHVLRGYGGTLGGYFMQAIDSMARENEMVLPATEWYQKPFIKRFFATANQPGLQNKFYELKDDVDGITQTINRLNEEGRYDELATFYATNGHMYEMRKDLNYLEKQITRLRDQRKIIEQMDIDPESKRQQIEQINMMISATLTSVPMYRKMAYDKE